MHKRSLIICSKLYESHVLGYIKEKLNEKFRELQKRNARFILIVRIMTAH